MSETIQKVVVVGAGTMGHGIAQVAAQAGCRVTLQDVEDDALAAGMERIRKNLDKAVSLGKVGREIRDDTLDRLDAETDLGYAPENSTHLKCKFLQCSGGDPLRFEVCERGLISDA